MNEKNCSGIDSGGNARCRMFSGCKGAVGIDSGRTKDPIRFTAEPTQAVLPTDLVVPTSVPESLSVNENEQKASSFVLDVTLSTDEHMLTVEQTTDYLNPAGKIFRKYTSTSIPKHSVRTGAVQLFKA